MKIWVLNKIVPLWLFSWYLTSIFHLSPAVSKKYTSVLNFLGNKGIWLRTSARETKVSNYKKLAWKVKLSHKMNESQHNQYIKTKSVKVPSDLKLKTAISRFVFQIFPVNKLRWFVSSNWIYFLMKNKSVKLQFVAKNSKHLRLRIRLRMF